MTDYIDRQAVLDAIREDPMPFTLSLVIYHLRTAPAADVAPVVHGAWALYPRAHYYKCNKCKYTVPYRKAVPRNGKREYHYCPNCGAKMDGGAEDG